MLFWTSFSVLKAEAIKIVLGECFQVMSCDGDVVPCRWCCGWFGVLSSECADPQPSVPCTALRPPRLGLGNCSTTLTAHGLAGDFICCSSKVHARLIRCSLGAPVHVSFRPLLLDYVSQANLCSGRFWKCGTWSVLGIYKVPTKCIVSKYVSSGFQLICTVKYVCVRARGKEGVIVFNHLLFIYILKSCLCFERLEDCRIVFGMEG